MLTQKAGQPGPSRPKIRAEILIDGFVPQREPQERFDIAPSFKAVVDYLGTRGFRVEGCADYNGRELHGGDLSGVPWNACQFDVFANPENRLQARLSVVLKILSDTINFRAQAVFRTMEPLSGTATRLRTVYFSYENPKPEAALDFIKAAESAPSIDVQYRFCGGSDSFRLD